MADEKKQVGAVDRSRLEAFLDRVPLPLRLRFADGGTDYAAHLASGFESRAPELSAFAGKAGLLELFGRRLADALVREEGGRCRVELSRPAFEPGGLEDFALDAPFPVAVVVGERTIDIGAAGRLRAGSLVEFDRQAGEALELLIEEPRRLLCRGEAVTIDGTYAMRVIEAVPPEPIAAGTVERPGDAPRALARLVLGRGSLTLREAIALVPGAIVKLDTQVGSPARFEIEGGASLAADVLIVDERFAARLLPVERLMPAAQPLPADAGLSKAEARDDAPATREPVRPERLEATPPSRAGAGDPALVAAISASPDAAARGLSALLAADKRSEAALALIAIGPELAAELFKRLREDEIESLTFEIARRDSTGAEELDAALSTLASWAQGAAAAAEGGIDYAREVLERALGAQGAVEVIERLTASLQVRPFDFIRRAEPERVLEALRTEHPQVMALVLSLLDPMKAAIVLSRLPFDLQGDVIKRIATMESVSCESVREIERVLEARLASADGGDELAAGGTDAAVEILNLVDRATEKSLVEFLEEDDPELAAEIKKRMFVFEDIVLLDDRSLQKTLRELDSRDVAMALKGVAAEVQEKFFRNMSKRAALMLKEDLEFIGPLRISEVEAARQRVIAVIRRLEEAGEIVIARAGEERPIEI